MASKRRSRQPTRRERRFFPKSAANPVLVRVMGGLGAMAMGAGVWGQFLSSAPEPLKSAPWILAAGAALFGLAIWIGTSGDPVLRVGDGGVGLDRGTVRRIPWRWVESVSWDADKRSVTVSGRDEADAALVVTARLETQPQAAAWIVKEARLRASETVSIPEDAEIPDAIDDSEDVVVMDPLQVVGLRCAKSKKIISFEPDARVCTRCERVYHKDHVPKRCACGATLAHLRGQKTA